MAEENNLVSVIIPYFNKVTTIERAVDSVINQSHSNWEIIIVDDCSKIKLEKLGKWENYNITILFNEINLGPGPTRQRALDLAKGQYVAFLDADDWWEVDFFKISLEGHHQNSNSIAFTWVKTNTLFANGVNYERKHNNKNLSKIRESLIKYGHPWSTSSLLWNKKYCAKWKNLTTNQDSLFEIDSSFNCNEICHINQILCIKDETIGSHRVNLVKREKIIENRYMLYRYILIRCFNKFNFIYKIISINRYLWCVMKIGSTTEKSKISKNEFIQRICIMSAKLLHFLFKKTFFKIYIVQ